MTNKEVRMRCIEALSAMGVREPQRITQDAAKLEEWILAAAEDKDDTPRKRGPKPKTADKE